MEELLFWSSQVLQDLTLKRLSVGLNEDEQRLLNGLKASVDRAHSLEVMQAEEKVTSTEHLNISSSEADRGVRL